MKPSELRLIICCSLLLYVIHGPFHGKASAEIPIEDTPQFHSQKHERSHLLAHLADRMDLDGEGLRHIQRHLSEVTGESEQNQDVKDVEAGDNAKGIFYFFKLHDYDDNEKLDGLEWMKALTDFHQEDNDKGEFKEGGRVFLEHEAEAIIDELLTKHDLNDDGMIDFLELMNSRVKSLMTDLDKPVPGEDGGEQEQQQNVEEQSSLEQEFKQLPHGQQHSEHDQPQHENGQQDNRQQDQQEEHNQGGPNSEELQGDQEEQDKQQQHEPSLNDEYQQHQQEDQQQEQTQQDQNPDGKQGDQEQQDSWQKHETSLDDEYKQQQQNHQQEDQQQEQNQQEHNPEETQGDQEQLQREPSLEDEYNQQQQQH